MSSLKSAAIGVAVSCARSSGLATTYVTSRPDSAWSTALAICTPSSEKWKPGRRPYRIRAGLWTSPCRSTCTVVFEGSVMWCVPRRPCRVRQRRGDLLQRGVAQRRRHETRLERAGRQVDAAREHLVEERLERRRVLGAGRLVVDPLGVGEEDREHVARVGQAVRDTGGVEGRRGQRADRGGELVEPLVDRVVGEPERGEAGRTGQRVTGECARLVDRAGGSEAGHDVAAAAEGGGRQAAAHHLAEGEQARVDRVEPGPSARGDAEAGHHLVDDEQRTVCPDDLGEALI